MNIQDKIKQLEDRINGLQNEVNYLKRRVGVPIDEPAIQPVRAARPVEPSPPKETAEPVKREVDWEHLIGRVWLPRIFVVVLLIGVLWGFGAAVSAGIITEPVRCLVGVVAAGLLLWQGERQMRKNRPALGQVLLGASVSLCMLTIFAAHMLYGLLPTALAFGLNMLAIAAGVWISMRHKSEAMMILSALGGFLVPFLVVSDIPNFWVFTMYEAIFSITLLYVSVKYRFNKLFYVAFSLLHLSLFVGTAEGTVDRYHGGAAFVAAVSLHHLALFALLVLRKTQETSRIALLFVSFSFTCVWVRAIDYYFEAFVLFLGVAYLLWTIMAVMRNRAEKFVTMSAATLSLFLWINEITDGPVTGLMFIVQGFLAVAIGSRFKSKLQQITGTIVYITGALSILSRDLDAFFSMESLSGLLLIVTLYFLYELLKRTYTEKAVQLQRLLWLNSLLILWFITLLTSTLTGDLNYEMQHLVISFVWAAYAIAIMVLGIWANRKKVRLAGILFLFITLLKIIFVDLPDVSVAVRAVLFIVLGCIGILVSRLSYRNNKAK
ncbi:DUF2339 domain-containing protein [Paenibacillus tarimensis]|uniref:DUF2339 domain-containing protein n=1 Tax=Paenibacillus tarimensis TaxID=416012 RepID=UPI001F27D704|nr:DUF2339 domain-containing protein [Paenibacillus tarimensis]MCF2946345.1 DUF2339 domain-containing protein [Paenibacillus tarimensis]